MSYEVGYGKPPKQHQFQKGRSGNPKGRPRKKRPDQLDVAGILNKPLRNRSTGQEMTTFEIGVRKEAADALAGKTKAIISFLKRCNNLELLSQAEAYDSGVILAPRSVKNVPEWTRQGAPGLKELQEERARGALEAAEKERRARRDNPLRADIVHSVAFEMHPITFDGVSQKMTTIEVVLLLLRRAAAEGDPAALAYLERLLNAFDPQDLDDLGRPSPGGVIVLPESVPVMEWVREQLERNKTRKPPPGVGEIFTPSVD